MLTSIAAGCPRPHCIQMLTVNPVPVVWEMLLGVPACQQIFWKCILNSGSMFYLVVLVFLFVCLGVFWFWWNRWHSQAFRMLSITLWPKLEGNWSHLSGRRALQRTQCSESKLVAEGTHRNGPAKRKRQEKQHRNSTLLKINRRHSPSSLSISRTALLALNQECDAASPRETSEIWGGQVTPIPAED